MLQFSEDLEVLSEEFGGGLETGNDDLLLANADFFFGQLTLHGLESKMSCGTHATNQRRLVAQSDVGLLLWAFGRSLLILHRLDVFNVELDTTDQVVTIGANLLLLLVI